MSNLTKYFSDIAKVLGISKDGIYDLVVALMAAGTADEDIEEVFKIMIGQDKIDTADSLKGYNKFVTKLHTINA